VDSRGLFQHPSVFSLPAQSSYDLQRDRKNDVKSIPEQEYTTDFNEQAIRCVDDVGSIARVAEELGLVDQMLRNWAKAAKAGQLNPAGAKQIIAQ